jgi:Mrp family chromosome partitioning ATPase
VPVVASVPAMPHRRRGRHEVTAVREPQSGLAEAYRSLRSALFLLPSRTVPADPAVTTSQPAFDPAGLDRPVHDPKVLLFVSPRAGDGKTTSLVNLASTLAEAGRSVIVLDCDFRHPDAHEFLDVMPGKGLSDLLAAGADVPLSTVLQPSVVPGVQLAIAGTSTRHPGALMGLMKRYVTEARELADVVLVDAPPVLLANDAIDLMPMVESVIIVVREGRTSTSEALRIASLLGRLQTPCLGAVLVGSRDAGAAYFDQGDGLLRRSRRGSGRRMAPAGQPRHGRHGRGGS